MKEIWNFYLGLFSHENILVPIGTVTATIAVLTFLITFVIRPLFVAVKNYFAKIKVIIGISHQMAQGLGSVTMLAPLLTVTITNRDRIVRYIQNPSIQLPRKIDGYRQFGIPALKGVYPKRLEPGEQHNVEFDTIAIYNQLLVRLQPNDKIEIIASDTSGKKYYSNKMKVSNISGHIKLKIL